MTMTLEPIGYIDSPYREKFAIPRQPGLVPSAQGTLVMRPNFSSPDFFRGLESFSHLWLHFIFHQNLQQGWQPLVRPPRLGGNKKVGVFASRSTFRPNALGLSVVALQGIEYKNGQAFVHITGLDLLHNTPVVDIKPYLPYADAITNAQGGYAADAPQTFEANQVFFSAQAQETLAQYQQTYPHLQNFICEVLRQDPRPAYQQQTSSDRIYGMQLYQFNITWQVQENNYQVLAITALST